MMILSVKMLGIWLKTQDVVVQYADTEQIKTLKITPKMAF